MEYPIELIPDIPVKLGAHQTLLRGQHIVVFRVAGPGGIKESNPPLVHSY
jgi:hypothetical protein